MENKPSIDPGILASVALGLLSIMGIALIFFLGRENASRPAGEMTATETPFRYLYLGTEPGLSTLTPEPTSTPISIEPPAATEEPDPNEPPFGTQVPDFPPLVTSTSSNPAFPTNPSFPTQPAVRTSTPTASETIPAVQKNGSCRKIHAMRRKRNAAGATRLRLRLSNIFHCERGVSGFLCGSGELPGTDEKSHGAICQSPRIHRCRLLTSAL